MSTLAQRRILVEHVANYVLEGPYAVTAQSLRLPEPGWLEPELRLSQYLLASGPMEGRSLYTFTYDDAFDGPAVVRRIIWQREQDQDRCRRGPVPELDLTVDFFTIQGQELSELKADLRVLDRLMLYGWYSKEDDSVPSLNLPVAPVSKKRDEFRLFRRKIFRKSLAADSTLSLLAGESSTYDTIWTVLWNRLGAACVSGKLVPEVEESYEIDLPVYRSLLTHRLEHPDNR